MRLNGVQISKVEEALQGRKLLIRDILLLVMRLTRLFSSAVSLTVGEQRKPDTD